MIDLSNASEITFAGKDVAKIEMINPNTSNWGIVWQKSTPPPPTYPHKLFIDTNSFQQQSLKYYIEIDDVTHVVPELEAEYDISNAKKLCWGPTGVDYNIHFTNETSEFGGDITPTEEGNKFTINLESLDYPPDYQNIFLSVITK